jgi:hypothetical protein
MEREFTIQLSVKTPAGFVAYAEYAAGTDPEAADELFNKLKGRRMPEDTTMLYVDLMEKIGDVPASARAICCTLDELVENCRYLALHAFRINNMKTNALK